MALEVINPTIFPRWDEMILENRGYAFFHSSAWAKVLQYSYHYTPAYFTLTRGATLLAMLPVMEVDSFLTGRRGVSLTFSDYCEPLIDDETMFPALFGQVVDFGRKSGWKHIELRGGRKYLSDAPVSARYLGHTLDLCADERDIFARFSSSTRRNIRKATREGVEVRVCTTLRSVLEFYQLHCLTRKRHGVPPQPFYFFRNIYDCIISQHHGIVVLASYRGEDVAGAIYFHFGNKALYKFAARNDDYEDLKASYLTMSAAIKWYSLRGYGSLCFGRTDCDNEGLRQYKKKWGTTETDIVYYRYDVVKDCFIEDCQERNRMMTTMLRQMPKPVLKAIGLLLYKHIG